MNNIKVLLVEDCEDDKILFEHDLSMIPDKDYDITWINTDFTNQIKLTDPSEFDVVFLDYNLGTCTGLDILALLKGKELKVPVIFLTGQFSVEIRNEAREHGCDGYFRKEDSSPFILETIIDQAISHTNSKNLLMRRVERQLKLFKNVISQEGSPIPQQVFGILAKISSHKEHGGYSHLLRLSHLVGKLSQKQGLPEETVRLFMNISLIHDIGKVLVSDDILKKTSKLSKEEMSHVRKHVVVGYELLMDSGIPELKNASKIILSHHERWDGSGYPEKLTGENIPLGSRIILLCETFDLLTSTLSYHSATSFEKAIIHIREHSGISFDPKLVELFVKNEDEFFKIKNDFCNLAGEY